MKLDILIIGFLLASIFVGSSLPVDSTVHGARDASIVPQTLKSFDIDAVPRLNELSEGVSFDKAFKSTGDELLVSKKSKKAKLKLAKAKKKKKKQKMKDKAKKASPTKTKKK